MKISQNQHPHHATAELKRCPLDSNCLQSSLVYICKATTPQITNDYPH